MDNNSLDRARQEINKIDAEMAELFAKRMQAVKAIAEYKAENSIPVLDVAREAEVIEKNSNLLKNDEIKDYYLRFLKSNSAKPSTYIFFTLCFFKAVRYALMYFSIIFSF